MKKVILASILISCLVLSGCQQQINNLELEEKIQSITHDNEVFKSNNDSLNSVNEQLSTENKKLEEDLLVAKKQVEEMEKLIESEVNKRREICVFAYSNDVILFSGDTDLYDSYEVITILGKLDDTLEKGDSTVLDYRDTKGAVIKIKVTGSLYDFKIVKLGWDPKTEDPYDEGIVCSFDKVQNTDILINSILPEGMPREEIRWKDEAGNEHSFFLSDMLYDPGYPYPGGIIVWGNAKK